MTFEVRRDGDHRRSPWRNGAGVTAEVASWPSGAEARSTFDWRISLAEVSADCEFSSFPGIYLVILLLDGPAMTLRLGESTHVLEPYEPFAFEGESPVSCEVEQPTRDLNVMTRRGRAVAAVQALRLRSGEPVELPPAQPLVVVCLNGTVRAAGTELRTADVVISDERLIIEGDGRAAVISIYSDQAQSSEVTG